MNAIRRLIHYFERMSADKQRDKMLKNIYTHYFIHASDLKDAHEHCTTETCEEYRLELLDLVTERDNAVDVVMRHHASQVSLIP